MVKVTLDIAGMGRVLKSPEMGSMVTAAAERIAAGARGRTPRGGEVVVESYETDREAAAVVVKHPRAAGLEKKRGILIPSARAIGASVTAKK